VIAETAAAVSNVLITARVRIVPALAPRMAPPEGSIGIKTE
jgi:hypothetical protein